MTKRWLGTAGTGALLFVAACWGYESGEREGDLGGIEHISRSPDEIVKLGVLKGVVDPQAGIIELTIEPTPEGVEGGLVYADLNGLMNVSVSNVQYVASVLSFDATFADNRAPGSEVIADFATNVRLLIPGPPSVDFIADDNSYLPPYDDLGGGHGVKFISDQMQPGQVVSGVPFVFPDPAGVNFTFFADIIGRLVRPNAPIINEFMFDTADRGTSKFVEIYNPGPGVFNLNTSACVVSVFGGNGSTGNIPVNLCPDATIPADGYWYVGNWATNGTDRCGLAVPGAGDVDLALVCGGFAEDIVLVRASHPRSLTASTELDPAKRETGLNDLGSSWSLFSGGAVFGPSSFSGTPGAPNP